MSTLRGLGILAAGLAGLALVPAPGAAQMSSQCPSIGCSTGRRLLVRVPADPAYHVQSYRIYADTASMWAVGSQAISVVLVTRWAPGPGPDGGDEARYFDVIDCQHQKWRSFGYRFYFDGRAHGPLFVHPDVMDTWKVFNEGSSFPDEKSAYRGLGRLCTWARADGMFTNGGGE